MLVKIDNLTNLNIDPAFNQVFPKIGDFNLAITLVGIYFIFEFGSLQGLFPLLVSFKIPLILALISVSYALFIFFQGSVDTRTITTKRFVLLCSFIILYAIISTKIYENKIELIKAFTAYLAYYIIIVTKVKKPSEYILLLDIWLASIAMSSFHGIMQGGKIWGNIWLKDENHISLVAAMAIPFAFMLYKLVRPIVRKLFYATCLFLYVSVNVIAHSRGGTLSMILAAFFCWLLTPHKFRNLTIILLVTIMVLSFAPPVFFEEMATLKQGTQEGTAEGRIYLWGKCIEMFYDHPILGVGPMNNPYFFSGYDDEHRYPPGYHRPPHTTPLQWLAEFGIIGVIVMLLFQKGMFMNWKLAMSEAFRDEKLQHLRLLTHACAISQVAFWFGSIFLSLMPYPFYWCLPYFSETWKNISLSFINDTNNK